MRLHSHFTLKLQPTCLSLPQCLLQSVGADILGLGVLLQSSSSTPVSSSLLLAHVDSQRHGLTCHLITGLSQSPAAILDLKLVLPQSVHRSCQCQPGLLTASRLVRGTHCVTETVIQANTSYHTYQHNYPPPPTPTTSTTSTTISQLNYGDSTSLGRYTAE